MGMVIPIDRSIASLLETSDVDSITLLRLEEVLSSICKAIEQEQPFHNSRISSVIKLYQTAVQRAALAGNVWVEPPNPGRQMTTRAFRQGLSSLGLSKFEVRQWLGSICGQGGLTAAHLEDKAWWSQVLKFLDQSPRCLSALRGALEATITTLLHKELEAGQSISTQAMNASQRRLLTRQATRYRENIGFHRQLLTDIETKAARLDESRGESSGASSQVDRSRLGDSKLHPTLVAYLEARREVERRAELPQRIWQSLDDISKYLQAQQPVEELYRGWVQRTEQTDGSYSAGERFSAFCRPEMVSLPEPRPLAPGTESSAVDDQQSSEASSSTAGVERRPDPETAMDSSDGLPHRNSRDSCSDASGESDMEDERADDNQTWEDHMGMEHEDAFQHDSSDGDHGRSGHTQLEGFDPDVALDPVLEDDDCYVHTEDFYHMPEEVPLTGLQGSPDSSDSSEFEIPQSVEETHQTTPESLLSGESRSHAQKRQRVQHPLPSESSLSHSSESLRQRIGCDGFPLRLSGSIGIPRFQFIIQNPSASSSKRAVTATESKASEPAASRAPRAGFLHRRSTQSRGPMESIDQSERSPTDPSRSEELNKIQALCEPHHPKNSLCYAIPSNRKMREHPAVKRGFIVFQEARKAREDTVREAALAIQATINDYCH